VLFQPLGINRFEWRGEFGGMPAPASGLRFLPRDFVKLGIMFASGGRWIGQQVVPCGPERSLRTPMPHLDTGADIAPCGPSRFPIRD
jgi:CubicO group peptidase (beta-lactamase class C family)